MNSSGPMLLSDTRAAVDAVIDRVGHDIVLGLPLGIGKPLRFANALYQRAIDDPSLKLHIVTGLSLQVPKAGSSLERRFLEPFIQRLYGAIPELGYARDAAAGKLPDNVKVSEFFFQAGSFLHQPQQQRHYVCSNYTHAVRDLMAQGINVIAQMVVPGSVYDSDPVPEVNAAGGQHRLSLSSNPDLTLDLIPLLRQRQQEGTPVALLAEINRALPFMGNDAAVAADTFDVVLDEPSTEHPLFSVPQTAVSAQDHLIGFYASTLLRDGGTLQVGIGSLGTALVHSTILRHKQNARWRQLYERLNISQRFPFVADLGGMDRFDKGLYGCSEMMMEGFLHLMHAGVLTRKVAGDVVMHGGFYLGSNAFYEGLRKLPPEQREQICMTSVNFINDLFDHRLGDQRLKASQRVHSRFINSAMMHTLSGAAISDGLDDGRVISGVGGQYNFVAMAHELPDARSIVTLRSTREKGGEAQSNIVFNYAHCTIPRHLRDIVITEYGIADLRGQPDEEVYCRLIGLADARFQAGLLAQAQQAGKIATDFKPPAHWQHNTPDTIRSVLSQQDSRELFPAFPFGHDFTDHELQLSAALKALEAGTATRTDKIMTVLKALVSVGRVPDQNALLARMSLDSPRRPGAWLERRLLLHALRTESK
ncbi:acetyl-CoA hydrolase/transferase C-terminal domain-containing protein [Pseudohongiella sp.]|uniref:Acetyl-CoA hydrolase/transferase C-terminal domain-containing protein n=1 Tax=marine sediment metagenome TaxID=412755 RepID=A0A0F9YLF6_9ZZZZ|nr:acetyl-CoA hydrolase/transferase C-terminal domain-containing protein [Pseudohongiella sp.]HDZ10365.1 acetyl-CoA hydrolase [Pseudohongiella sp.]HEA62012.1 acetyl-CoA hydrolase [Pseudohongiella sp.]